MKYYLMCYFYGFFAGILDVITEPDKFLEELVKSLP